MILKIFKKNEQKKELRKLRRQLNKLESIPVSRARDQEIVYREIFDIKIKIVNLEKRKVISQFDLLMDEVEKKIKAIDNKM